MIFSGDTDIEAGNPIATSLAKPKYMPKLAAMNDEIPFWGALVLAHLRYASDDPTSQVLTQALNSGQTLTFSLDNNNQTTTQ